MDFKTAIEKANVGQRIKRRNPSTVSCLKKNMEMVKMTMEDLQATDWVIVIPKKVPVVLTVQDLAKKVKDFTLEVGEKVTFVLGGKKLTGSVKSIVR